jgi:hypothetical protein
METLGRQMGNLSSLWCEQLQEQLWKRHPRATQHKETGSGEVNHSDRQAIQGR